jgi:hypothetical protein
MQMAIDGRPLRRRDILTWLAALGTLPAWANHPGTATLLAAWHLDAEHHIGLLSAGRTHWSVQRSMAVPTRAHGLLVQPDGSVLAVARRPGDWLLRWHPNTGLTHWRWMENDQRFNGHMAISTDGGTLWTTETDLGSAQGRLGVREAHSLRKTADWHTHGMDPHQVMLLPQALGGVPAGALLVANGGIAIRPETGRIRQQPGQMDASLVALHPGSGTLLGLWRLADANLSIRHLAWNPESQTLGIALQAEHVELAARTAAPVLAVWNGVTLRTTEKQPPELDGYGGDICALPGGGFAVSCPRVHRLALFDAHGLWLGSLDHRGACGLTVSHGQWWLASTDGSGTLRRAVRSQPADPRTGAVDRESRLPKKGDLPASQAIAPPAQLAGRLRLDNHWAVWNGLA